LRTSCFVDLHHGTLINQHQIDTLFLVCLLGVNAGTCFERYSPILSRLCTDVILCNYVRRMCVDYVQVHASNSCLRRHTGMLGTVFAEHTVSAVSSLSCNDTDIV
jgi:hypothetical protein